MDRIIESNNLIKLINNNLLISLGFFINLVQYQQVFVY